MPRLSWHIDGDLLDHVTVLMTIVHDENRIATADIVDVIERVRMSNAMSSDHQRVEILVVNLRAIVQRRVGQRRIQSDVRNDYAKIRGRGRRGHWKDQCPHDSN